MSSRTRKAGRGSSTILAVLVAVGAMLTGVVACQSPVSAPASSAAAPPAPPAAKTQPSTNKQPSTKKKPGTKKPPGGAGQAGGALGRADGTVPEGATVYDDLPAVANLDPKLLEALREAAADAADDGVEFVVNSGWRSAAYQKELLRKAIKQYGSAKEAARWVATPEKSLHVSGDAIDLGPAAAATWLSEHGARYGLCQIYDNEPWHYELRPKAADGCPPRYADPTQDPRLRR